MSWESVSADGSFAVGCTANVVGDNVLRIGGQPQDNEIPSNYLNISNYSLKKLDFEATHINTNGIANRRHHAAVTLGNTVVLIGGSMISSFRGEAGNLLDEVVTCKKTPFGVKCAVDHTMPAMNRMGHSATVFGDGRRAVVFGGKSGGSGSSATYPNDVWIYKPVAPGSESAKSRPASGVVASSGSAEEGSPAVKSPNANWIPVEFDTAAATAAGAPTGRYFHSATVCGDRNQYLVVVGGLVPKTHHIPNPVAIAMNPTASPDGQIPEIVESKADAATNEVWLLDLSAYVTDAPQPTAAELAAAAEAKAKAAKGKAAKDAAAGPPKPTATWHLITQHDGGAATTAAGAAALAARYNHFAYKAAAGAAGADASSGASVLGRFSLMGGCSRQNVDFEVFSAAAGGAGVTFEVVKNTATQEHTLYVCPSAASDLAAGEGGLSAGPSVEFTDENTSYYGCVFAALPSVTAASSPRAAASEEGPGEGAAPEVVIPEQPTAAAVLCFNHSVIRRLPLAADVEESFVPRGGMGASMSASSQVRKVGRSSSKSAGRGRSSPTMSASNSYASGMRPPMSGGGMTPAIPWAATSGVHLLALEGDAEVVAALRHRMNENRKEMQRRLHGRTTEDEEAERAAKQAYQGLFRRAITFPNGDQYSGELVYVRNPEIPLTAEEEGEEDPYGEVMDTTFVTKEREAAILTSVQEDNGLYLAVREGQGDVFVSAEDGSTYTGTWVRNERSGTGLYTDVQRSLVYRGMFERDGFTEYGCLYYGTAGEELGGNISGTSSASCCEYYVGEFFNNKRDGPGRLYLISSEGNKGDTVSPAVAMEVIENTSREAVHKMVGDGYKATLIYEGDWAEDKMCGHGTRSLPDGSSYTGPLLSNLPHGNDGVCNYADGSRYIGQWRNGLRNGTGTYTTAKNEVYEGKWVADKRTGKGVWRSVLTGEIYDGIWENHVPHGYGTWTYSDKSVYVGEFVDGKRQGQGTMKYSGGSSSSGNTGGFVSPTAALGATGGNVGGGTTNMGGTMASPKSRVAMGSSTYTGSWYKGMRHGAGRWISTGHVSAANASASATAQQGPSSRGGSVVSMGSTHSHKNTGSASVIADYEVSYEGEWQFDKRHGEGKAMFVSGSSFSGLFEADAPVKTQAQ